MQSGMHAAVVIILFQRELGTLGPTGTCDVSRLQLRTFLLIKRSLGNHKKYIPIVVLRWTHCSQKQRLPYWPYLCRRESLPYPPPRVFKSVLGNFICFVIERSASSNCMYGACDSVTATSEEPREYKKISVRQKNEKILLSSLLCCDRLQS